MTQTTSRTAKFNYEVQKITWQNIGIEIRYSSNWSIDDTGYGFAHLEIVSDDQQKLPITETGYRSHFLTPEEINARGGAVEYAIAWLSEASKQKDWQVYLESQRQLTLF